MKYYIIFDENYKIIGNTIQDTPPEGVFGYLEVDDIEVSRAWYLYRLTADHTGVELIPYAPPVPPTFDQIAAQLQVGVQNHMDDVARSFGYDNILTASTYADEPADPTFQAEGQALRAWRSLCWRACYTMFAEASAGAISVPDLPAVLAALPADPVQTQPRSAVTAAPSA